MRRSKRYAQAVLAIVFLVMTSACFAVRVVENVRNPSRYFDQAYSEIERIHRLDPHREGTPRRVKVLIYDASERKLIRIAAPFWLVETCADIGERASQDREEMDFAKRYDFDWGGLEDLEKVGPGLLAEIDDHRNKILVWID